MRCLGLEWPRVVDPAVVARENALRASAASSQSSAHGDVVLPPGFSERIRTIPGGMSQLHTPEKLRARLAKAWAETLEGMAADLPGWTRLEEGRTRLLLTTPPAGIHVQTEISERLSLWENRQWTALLARVEAQLLISGSRSSRGSQSKRSKTAAAASKRRAKRMTREGAYSKALKTASGTPASLSAVEESRLAAQLLPPSARADALVVVSMEVEEQHQQEQSQREGGEGENAGERVSSRQPLLGMSFTGRADEHVEHPLKGVRFAAMTGPGPTGTRAEHAKELLAGRSRRVCNRLCRAMAAVQHKIKCGQLIEEARWIKRTRLVLIEKKNSRTPRPIRVGEFLRASTCKRLQRQAAPRLRRAFRTYHQWGVSMPGGCEAMVHWRSTVEELACNGTLEPLVAFDLDLRNMYGSVEWAEIRAAVERDFQEAGEWVRWQHTSPDEVDLPSGGTAFTDRGAGQGDAFGSTQSSLTLGGHMVTHRQRFAQSQPQGPSGAVDEWFIDDGQGFVKPHLAERWLQSVDQAIAAFGGSRASGTECKSVARLLCPPERIDEFAGWAGSHISSTCKVLQASVAPKVLGAQLGESRAITADFRGVTAKTEIARQAVRSLNNAPCELTLQRRCLDVGKASYILRCNGDCVVIWRSMPSMLRLVPGLRRF